MTEENKKILHFIVQCLPIAGLSSVTAGVIYAIHLGIFSSVESLHSFITGFGEYAVVTFILIQLVQVIIPILPGGISTVAGMLLFGPVFGLIYSYIGLVVGEIIAFFLVRYYGLGLVKLLLSEKNFLKFENYIEKSQKNLKKLIIATFLIPFGPDDLICFVAGISKMRFKEFLIIVLTLKPWSIAIYSFILMEVVQKFMK
ncbi:MAG: TVP38/TMEM64 family protein [Streptococcaceae bacterium]|nr:TVP38/TMEM64 family protein [Streptococcaceae bacterium]